MRHVIGTQIGGTVFVLLGAFRPPLLRAPTTILCELTSWAPQEDWALQDRAPQFTVGRGGSQATFWSALTASTPELAGRTPEECERRLRELGATVVGRQPRVLEDWSRLGDGRYTGHLDGDSSTVWLAVACEGRLASDPRTEPGYIEAVGGTIYELSRSGGAAPAVAEADSGVGGAAAAGGGGALQQQLALPLALPQQAVAALGAAILAGSLGFGLGTALTPPPPPPAPTPPRVTTRILIAPSASSGRAAPAQQPQQAPAEPAAAPRKLAPAPLTVTEQRERAELRVSRDKLQLQNLQQRLQEDEQRLSEFRRVEAEAGGSGEAVKMVFPPAS